MAYLPEEGFQDRNSFLASLVKLECVERKTKRGVYIETPCAFDIETSSFYEDGIEDIEHKRAIMYIWQFGINNKVTYGRTWDEFITLLHDVSKILNLSEERKLVCYVHYLSYEFGFIRKYFDWVNLFLEKRYKIYYGTSQLGIEFRDSLKLWGGRGLAAVGENLSKYPVKKMVGDIDYSLIRHSQTPLTDKELKYCENDIRVILHGIQEEIEECGGIHKIPLTNTQRVRNYCRDRCFADFKRYKKFISSLTITSDEYNQLKRAFQGGFTHANKYCVNKTINNVYSADIGSSYPTVMVLEQFPMGNCQYIANPQFTDKQFQNILKTKCCIFDMDIEGLEPAFDFENIISASKCHKLSLRGELINNGRVVRADKLTITVTNIDYELIMKFYKIAPLGSVKIYNMRIYDKGYLPKEIVETVLHFYKLKTQLKKVKGKEREYDIAKNMLNALYGMMVTDIAKEEWLYLPELDEVYQTIIEYEKLDRNQYIEGLIDKYNKSTRRFNWYPWGVYITAYARRNLIETIYKLGNDYCYSDTDCTKFINYEKNKHIFEEYNKEIDRKTILSSAHFNIPIENYRPENNGILYPIGHFEYDGKYKRFRTLGAKRYLVQLENDEYKLTISGANKKEACKYITEIQKEQNDPMNFFTNKMEIPEKYSGRTVHTYINNEYSGTVIDYLGTPNEYHELSGIHIANTSFTMNADRIFEFISTLKGGGVVYEEEKYSV